MLQHILQFIVVLIVTAVTPVVFAGPFLSPVDTPAVASRLASRSSLLAVAAAGKRLVAVGQRGHIVVSDDEGKTWLQAMVPVSVDLVAIAFPTEKKGWAVGHSGVVIHTEDGGLTWVKQFDGRKALQVAVAYYKNQRGAAAERALTLAQGQLGDGDDGAAQPFLGVMFENENTGFIVGTFNRIFRTDDGGETWIPWMTRIDNPNELHLYAIRGGANQIYITGEQGKVWRFDNQDQNFRMIATPYNGTLFGALIIDSSTVLAYGMRGSLFRSQDQGKKWKKVEVGNLVGIADGAVIPNGHVLLVNLAGEIEQSKDRGETFLPLQVTARRSSYFGVTSLSGNRLGLVGRDGASTMALP